MASFTECIDLLKQDIQSIANRSMTQDYPDLGDLFCSISEDTLEAKRFSESLNDVRTEHTPINNAYPVKALQCAWNIADILSVAIRYTPCEWSAGLFRGLTSSGINGELNAFNLLVSIEFREAI